MIRIIHDGPITYNELTWSPPETDAEDGRKTLNDLVKPLGDGTVYRIDPHDSYGVEHLDQMVYGEKIARQTQLSTLDGQTFRFVAGKPEKAELAEPAQVEAPTT